MNQAETTITLETADIIKEGGKTSKKVIDDVTNFTTNIWETNKEMVIIGGLLIVLLMYARNKKIIKI